MYSCRRAIAGPSSAYGPTCSSCAQRPSARVSRRTRPSAGKAFFAPAEAAVSVGNADENGGGNIALHDATSRHAAAQAASAVAVGPPLGARPPGTAAADRVEGVGALRQDDAGLMPVNGAESKALGQ